MDNYNQRMIAASQDSETPPVNEAGRDCPLFGYLDHIRSYPTFMFGGSVGSRIATVAFLRK